MNDILISNYVPDIYDTTNQSGAIGRVQNMCLRLDTGVFTRHKPANPF